MGGAARYTLNTRRQFRVPFGGGSSEIRRAGGRAGALRDLMGERAGALTHLAGGRAGTLRDLAGKSGL